MPELQPQFIDARSNVEPRESDKEGAIDAHTEVREALEKSSDLKAMEIDSILIGSYARKVSIRRIQDVDVFSRLWKPKDGVTPAGLLTVFENTLVEAFGRKRVTRQARSIMVTGFKGDLSVDTVPAKPFGDRWQIPSRDWDFSATKWIETNPTRLGDLTTTMNKAHGEEYVPTVKLIRQTRRTNIKDQPNGLYFEIATLEAFAAIGKWNAAGEYFVRALAGVARILSAAAQYGLVDPTIPGKKIDTRAEKAEIEAAAKTFSSLATKGRKALDSDDDCWAAKEFRDILGKNSEGTFVFPMPSFCNPDGTPKATAEGVKPGGRAIPGEDRTFA